MGKNFRPLGFCRRQDLQGGSVVCLESTRSGVQRPEFYSRLHYRQVVGLGTHPLHPELCLEHNRHSIKYVEWISVRELKKSVFSHGTLEDPPLPGAEGGKRETSRLPTPCILPHLAPSHDHLPTAVIFTEIRIPESPLLQRWEASKETGSVVHCGVTWYSSEMAPLAPHARPPLSQMQRAPSRAPSLPLWVHHLPPNSRFTSRIHFHLRPWTGLFQNL